MTKTPALPVEPGSNKLASRLRLPAASLQLVGHMRREFLVKAPPETTQEDCRSPYFLSHVATKLTRHDLITILADDESWELLVCVEKVLLGEVHVSARKVFGRESINTVGHIVDDAGDYRTEFRAGKGWCVIRSKDGHPIISGHANEAGARAQFHREAPRKAA